MAKESFVGKVFGRLTVIGEETKSIYGTRRSVCLVRCECGKQKEVTRGNLITGTTNSCGCLQRELLSARGKANATHGHTSNGKRSGTYGTWQNMVLRCTMATNEQYENYGGRGITVCERWLKFDNFLADMGERPQKLSLDRKDNEKGYEPGNCRWATSREQNRNMRSNVMLEHKGKKQCMLDWAREVGISPVTLRVRLKKLGWSVERSLTTPVRKVSIRP